MKFEVYRRAARHAAAWWRRRSGADVTNDLAFIRCNVYSCACCYYKSYHLDDDIISIVIVSLEVRARRRYIVSEL
jgi:hypothetical protein